MLEQAFAFPIYEIQILKTQLQWLKHIPSFVMALYFAFQGIHKLYDPV